MWRPEGWKEIVDNISDPSGSPSFFLGIEAGADAILEALIAIGRPIKDDVMYGVKGKGWITFIPKE